MPHGDIHNTKAAEKHHNGMEINPRIAFMLPLAQKQNAYEGGITSTATASTVRAEKVAVEESVA